MTVPPQPQPALSIVQYWDSPRVPDSVAALVETFRRLNPDFCHHLYGEAEAEELIGECFGTRELAAFRACAVPSMQSDYLRYCAVLARGGVYADVDYRCRRPLRSLLEGLDQGEIFLGPSVHEVGGRPTRRVWSGFFAFRQPGHPFLRLALDIATANLEARIAERLWPAGENAVEAIWFTVGPGVPTLMRYLREWGSFDAFLEAAVGTPAEPFAGLYCEAVGDYDRVVAAFDGVSALPYERMTHWVAEPEQALPYKETADHWHNVRTAIFR